jgi:CxxC motif-containing protein (DUF1111 family)
MASFKAPPKVMRCAPRRCGDCEDVGRFCMTDGAQTALEAIRLHDGEAKIVRDRFLALPQTQQGEVLDFLNSI